MDVKAIFSSINDARLLIAKCILQYVRDNGIDLSETDLEIKTDEEETITKVLPLDGSFSVQSKIDEEALIGINEYNYYKRLWQAYDFTQLKALYIVEVKGHEYLKCLTKCNPGIQSENDAGELYNEYVIGMNLSEMDFILRALLKRERK